MNRPVFVGIHRSAAVHRIARDVEHAAERCLADGHLHGIARIEAILAADQAVGAAQCDATHAAAAEVLLHFAREIDLHSLVFGDNFDGVVNRRQTFLGELDIERVANDLRDAADVLRCRFSCRDCRRAQGWR